MQTIYIRIRSRLLELEQEIQLKVGQRKIECLVEGSPATLHVSILSPCLDSEKLLVTINPRTGSLQAFMPQVFIFINHKTRINVSKVFSKDDPPLALMMELQETLNGDKNRIASSIEELRFWIMTRRFQTTLQHLPVSVSDKLPILNTTDLHISRLGKHKLFLRLHKHPNSIIVVEFKVKVNL